MKFFSGYLLVIVVLLSAGTFNAQNIYKKWIFSNNAGLDFVTSPPTPLTGSLTGGWAGCASIADNNGNLLFYTNGVTVYDKNHNVMANGTGLDGGLLQQDVIILKKPTSPNLYYIFTISSPANSVTPTNQFVANPGLKYSVVDISLAAGNGSVITKNVMLYSPVVGGLSFAKHCNGSDYWIIAHEYNSSNFLTFLLSLNGVQTTPLIQSIGMTPSNSVFENFIRVAPNNKRVAHSILTALNNAHSIFDFDNSTGSFSNQQVLLCSINGGGVGCYGSMEFSPDCSKLYGAIYNSPFRIEQFDLCSGSLTNIQNSRTSFTCQSAPLTLQLSTNGKIYLSKEGVVNSSFLGVINNPNLAGTSCNFLEFGQSIAPKVVNHQLPNFTTEFQFSSIPNFSFTNNVGPCQSAQFISPLNIGNTVGTCIVNTATLQNLQWNFGDPLSGGNNSSSLSNPSHTFTGIGTYTVKLILDFGCGYGADTISQTITINNSCFSTISQSITCASLGTATVINSGSSAGPYTYTWLPGNQTGSTALNLMPGTYSVLIFDNSINYTHTLTTTFLPLVPLTATVASSSSVACFGASTGTATITGLTGGSGNQIYLWSNGVNTYTTAFTNSLSAGIWSVNVTDALTGCQINQSFFISQAPALNLTVSAASATTCVGKGIALNGANSGGTPGYTYTWTNGPSINTNTVTESIAGNYVYTLNSTDANICLSTATISIAFIVNPLVSVSNVSICPLAVGTLSATGANTYTWASSSVSSTGTSFTDSPISNTQYTLIGSALGCTSVVYPSISLYTLPTPVFTSNAPRCNGQNLQLNASGGVGFAFDGPQSFVSTLQNPLINAVTPLYSGVYNLTVTSVNGCTASTNQTLIVNPTPSLSVLGATVCNTQTLNLAASSVPGATYLWLGVQNFSSTLQNPSITNPSTLASGNYSVKVLSPQNCSNTAVVNVLVVPPPNLSSSLSGNGTLCAQALNGSANSITLTAGGAASYTLQTASTILNPNPYGPVSPLSTIAPFTPGVSTATLTGSNGVCSAYKTVTFNVIPNPTVTVSSATPVICVGQTFTYTNFGASSYTWGPGTPGLSTYTGPVTIASPTVTSVYSVVGGSLGCNSGTQTSTITVNPLPTVSITPKNPKICRGDALTLKALGNGTNFYWSPNLALSTTTGAVVNVSPVNQQTYQVLASLNSCTQSAIVTVSIHPLPLPEIIVSKASICLNDSIKLIGKGGTTFNWSGPHNLVYSGQTLSFVANSLSYGGKYILQVTDSNGCKNLANTEINVLDLPYGSLFSSNKYNCVPFTSAFTFSSPAKARSSWRVDGSNYIGNTFTHLFNDTGTFEIRGHLYDTASGCSNTVSFFVNAYPAPKADFKFLPEHPVEGFESVVFTNNSAGDFQNNWNWFFVSNNGYKANNESVSYLFLEAGLYPVAFVVQNKFGCSDSIIKVIKVESDFSIYVPNAFTPNNDALNDVFLPVLSGTKFCNVSIYDRWGAKVFESNSLGAGWDGTYRGQEAKVDTYIWKITASGYNGEQKILTGTVLLSR